MVYSIGKKSVFVTDPKTEVIGGGASWANMRFLHPETVDPVAKTPGYPVMGQGYPVVLGSAPQALLWKSNSKIPPDYAFGNNSIMLVSSKFRDIAEAFEPGLHQFLPVDVFSSKSSVEPFDQFYWFVVCALIDSLDKEHTTITWEGNYDTICNGLRQGGWYIDHSVTPPQKAVFSLRAIGDRHLWRNPYYNRDFVKCSNAFAKAMIEADLTGFALREREQV